jgi:hypothetical protein
VYRAGALVVPAAVWLALELVLVPDVGGTLFVSVAVAPVFGDDGCEDVLAEPVGAGEAVLHAASASPSATAAIPAPAVCRVVERRAKRCVPAIPARYEQTPGAT